MDSHIPWSNTLKSYSQLLAENLSWFLSHSSLTSFLTDHKDLLPQPLFLLLILLSQHQTPEDFLWEHTSSLGKKTGKGTEDLHPFLLLSNRISQIFFLLLQQNICSSLPSISAHISCESQTPSPPNLPTLTCCCIPVAQLQQSLPTDRRCQESR